MRYIVALLTACVVGLTLSGCHAEPVAEPRLVAVTPAQDSTVSSFDRVALEFNLPVTSCRVTGLMRGTLPQPSIWGNTVGWEMSATAPTGTWHVGVRGEFTFEDGRSIAVEKAWTFTLSSALEPAPILAGNPSVTSVTLSSPETYGITLAQPSTLRAGAAPSQPMVWEGPAGVLVQIAQADGDYVLVRPPVPDATPAFSGADATHLALPVDGGHILSSDVWVVPTPWLPAARIAAVSVPEQAPQVAITLEGTRNSVVQFTIDALPSAEAFDTAIAYCLFSQVYQTMYHVPAPGTDEVSIIVPTDVPFLVQQARADLEPELTELTAVQWPADLAQFEGRFVDFGASCRDASVAVLQLLDPATASEARERLAGIIEAGGRGVPGPDAQVYEWGEAAQAALGDIAERLKADMLAAMQPGLSLWEPPME